MDTLTSDGHNWQESDDEIKEGLGENGQGEEECDWEDGIGDEESDGETEIGEDKGEDASRATSKCCMALLAFSNMSRLVSLCRFAFLDLSCHVVSCRLALHCLVLSCLVLSCLVFLRRSLLRGPMSLIA
jgi:hypothetical protein